MSEPPRTAYVYAILVDGIVRYIGKGSGIPMKRAREHLRAARCIMKARDAGQSIKTLSFHSRLIKALRRDAKIETIAIVSGLSHEDAYAREVHEIASSPANQLWNSVSGGLGGMPVSAATRARQSAAAKARVARPGELERLRTIAFLAATPQNIERSRRDERAKAADPARRKFLSEIAKNAWRDPKIAARMSVGLEHGRKASSYTPERAKKRWADPKSREQYGAKMRAWWAKKRKEKLPHVSD